MSLTFNRNGFIYNNIKLQVIMLFTFNRSQILHQKIVYTCTTATSLWSVDLSTASDITSPKGFKIHLLQELRLFWSLLCQTLVFFGERKLCSSPYHRSLHLQVQLACSISLFHNLWRVYFSFLPRIHATRRLRYFSLVPNRTRPL